MYLNTCTKRVLRVSHLTQNDIVQAIAIPKREELKQNKVDKAKSYTKLKDQKEEPKSKIPTALIFINFHTQESSLYNQVLDLYYFQVKIEMKTFCIVIHHSNLPNIILSLSSL